MRILLLFLLLAGCTNDFKFSELDEQYVTRENKPLPQEVMPGTIFERVTLSGDDITRVYTLDPRKMSTDELAQADSRAEQFDAREVKQICADNQAQTLMSYGFKFFRQLTINDSNGVRVVSERISCQ